jgi:hypothetical protein
MSIQAGLGGLPRATDVTWPMEARARQLIVGRSAGLRRLAILSTLATMPVAPLYLP